jgi:hypothetical protein
MRARFPSTRTWRRLAGGWAAVVFVLMAWPGEKIPSIPALDFDKVLHALVFGTLAGLLLLGGWRVRTVALSVSAFGILTELWQHLTPFGRTGDVYDAFADVAGVGLACAIAWAWRKKRQPKQKSR